jgi:hypothetical protein
MASFPVHLGTSAALGVLYGLGGAHYTNTIDWGQAALAGGLTALGGILPDLDSDSGKPVREIFGVAGAFIPLLLIPRLAQVFPEPEQVLVIVASLYFFIRFGLANLFRRLTVHRGMFHSIPGMLICGLGVYLIYTHRTMSLRHYMALGVMIGFLSHLVLDEIYAVDFNGATVRLNKFAGSAVKLYSQSWTATLITYGCLGGLGYQYWKEQAVPPSFVQPPAPPIQQKILPEFTPAKGTKSIFGN